MTAPLISFDPRRNLSLLGAASTRRTRWLVLALLAAGVAGNAWLGHRWWQLHAALDDARGRSMAAQSLAVKRPAAAVMAQPELDARQRIRLNAMATRLNLPWHDVFEALEDRSVDGVALLQVEPDPSRGTFRVQAESKEIDSLLAYANRLADHPMFGVEQLVKHETNEQDPNRPARLAFELRREPRIGGGTK